jgi:outer membrane lipoprotein-sorting protein
MRRIGSIIGVGLTLALPGLTGCLYTTHKVQQAKMPAIVMTATADELIAKLNEQYDAINSITAWVEFRASTGGPRQGKEKTYTSFSGNILMRKPESIRVLGYVPVIHTKAFDMASNGNTFKLQIPSQNKVVEGSNAVTKESPNHLENMRPKDFFDSLLIKAVASDELVTLTTDSETKVDPKTKQLTLQPDYDLTILHRQGTSNLLIPVRVVHFNRIDLHAYQEDIYDEHGSIKTQAIYGPIQSFGDQKFPSTITIKWPLHEYQIEITVQKLLINQALKDDQFELTIPEGTKIQNLD